MYKIEIKYYIDFDIHGEDDGKFAVGGLACREADDDFDRNIFNYDGHWLFFKNVRGKDWSEVKAHIQNEISKATHLIQLRRRFVLEHECPEGETIDI